MWLFFFLGSGSSKKQAKHNAARAMLDKLDGRVPVQDGIQPMPAVMPPTGGGGVGGAPQAPQQQQPPQQQPQQQQANGTAAGANGNGKSILR